LQTDQRVLKPDGKIRKTVKKTVFCIQQMQSIRTKFAGY